MRFRIDSIPGKIITNSVIMSLIYVFLVTSKVPVTAQITLDWQPVRSIWSNRLEAGHAVWDNRMWISGGSTGGTSGIELNDVYCSDNGKSWFRTVSEAPWAVRAGHGMIGFNGRIWIVGGYMTPPQNPADKIHFNDLWFSTDGSGWTPVESTIPWAPRSHMVLLNHDDRLWVIAGESDSTRYRDVWSSDDGSSWTLMNSSITFSSNLYTGETFNGKMRLFGGLNPTVWSSADGISWTNEGTGIWGPRFGHRTAASQDRLWLTGGFLGVSPLNDVYTSGNGIDWSLVDSSASWPGRHDHMMVYFQDELRIMGGGRDFSLADNDIWTSDEGTTWVELKENWSPRYGHASIVFDNRMWVIGGVFPNRDVLSSTDGSTWTTELAFSPFPSSTQLQPIELNGSIELIGDGNVAADDEIWQSTDGMTWNTLSTVDNHGRTGHTALSFQGRRWVMGGLLGGMKTSTVWADDLTTVTSSPGWSPRHEHASTVFLDQMWVLGGEDSTIGLRNDVWASSDGSLWTRVTMNPAWSPRKHHTVQVYLDRIWVLAGEDIQGKALDDVYYSLDGETWIQAASTGPKWGARYEHTSLVTNDGFLWVLGGRESNLIYNDVWKAEAVASAGHWYFYSDH